MRAPNSHLETARDFGNKRPKGTWEDERITRTWVKDKTLKNITPSARIAEAIGKQLLLE